MFVVSLKAKKKKIIAIAAAAVFMICALFVLRAVLPDKERRNLEAGTNRERIEFLSGYGWEVEEEAIDVEEIVIPETFNDVYEAYNKIQLSQNMDLHAFEGCRCKKWVYRVLNYPKQTGEVYATLLVYEGAVIGGDISSAELGGFMHGFAGTGEMSPAELSRTDQETALRTEQKIQEDAWPTD